jgi:hypothetical protein
MKGGAVAGYNASVARLPFALQPATDQTVL